MHTETHYTIDKSLGVNLFIKCEIKYVGLYSIEKKVETIFQIKILMNSYFEIRLTQTMGKGMFALQDIQVGANILVLDNEKYITYRMIMDHDFFRKILQFEDKKLDKKMIFAFYMAFVQCHKQQQKYWSQKIISYIQNLPLYFHNLVSWKQDELQKLNNKDLIKKIQDKKIRLKQQFQQIKSCLIKQNVEYSYHFSSDFWQDQYYYSNQKQQNHDSNDKNNQSDETLAQEIDESLYISYCKEIKFQKVLHYYAAIQSRNIYKQSDIDKKSQVGCLVPMWQMFNHSPKGQLKDDVYYLKVIKPIKKDEQIFVEYGQRSPQCLLENYGFVIDQQFEKVKNQYISKQDNMVTKQHWLNKCQNKLSQIKIRKQRQNLAELYNKIYQNYNVRDQKNSKQN